MKKQVLIAVLLGIIAAMFTGLYLVSVESTYRISAQKIKVLITKQYINQGTFIDETMVQEVLVPKEYIQPKVLQSVKDLRTSDGRYLFMAVAPIEQGEQITTTKLSMLGIETGISAVIPTAQRAITIPLDSRVVNGIVKPGNRVDIVGIFEYQNKSSEQQQIALTLLQNILVLSVGDSVLGSLKTKQERGKELIPNEQQVSDSIPVSFSINSQEGELLALASEKGTIKLLLRPAGDETIINVKGAKMSDISKEMIYSQSSDNSQYLREMQKKQKEVISILKKYKQ